MPFTTANRAHERFDSSQPPHLRDGDARAQEVGTPVDEGSRASFRSNPSLEARSSRQLGFTSGDDHRSSAEPTRDSYAILNTENFELTAPFGPAGSISLRGKSLQVLFFPPREDIKPRLRRSLEKVARERVAQFSEASDTRRSYAQLCFYAAVDFDGNDFIEYASSFNKAADSRHLAATALTETRASAIAFFGGGLDALGSYLSAKARPLGCTDLHVLCLDRLRALRPLDITSFVDRCSASVPFLFPLQVFLNKASSDAADQVHATFYGVYASFAALGFDGLARAADMWSQQNLFEDQTIFAVGIEPEEVFGKPLTGSLVDGWFSLPVKSSGETSLRRKRSLSEPFVEIFKNEDFQSLPRSPSAEPIQLSPRPVETAAQTIAGDLLTSPESPQIVPLEKSPAFGSGSQNQLTDGRERDLIDEPPAKKARFEAV